MEMENPLEIESFQFIKERNEKLQNNLNLLNLLDSKKILLYGDSSNLENLNERFKSVQINEEDIEKLNYEEYKNVMKFCQTSIELYNYMQTIQNNEILQKYQDYQTFLSAVISPIFYKNSAFLIFLEKNC